MAAVFHSAAEVGGQLECVDHGLRLVEADGVSGQPLQDIGEGSVDGVRTFDVWECVEVEVGVAGALFPLSGFAVGIVVVAVVLASKRRAAALVAVRHRVPALRNHRALLAPRGVSKSLKTFALIEKRGKVLKLRGLPVKSLFAIKKPAIWRAFCLYIYSTGFNEIVGQIA
jgi:hypothetical protein